jgi:hypothetical protein
MNVLEELGLRLNRIHQRVSVSWPRLTKDGLPMPYIKHAKDPDYSEVYFVQVTAVREGQEGEPVLFDSNVLMEPEIHLKEGVEEINPQEVMETLAADIQDLMGEEEADKCLGFPTAGLVVVQVSLVYHDEGPEEDDPFLEMY